MFCQAEEGPSLEHVPVEIKSYLAERRIWEFYFGESIPFPGVDPRVDPTLAIKNKLHTLSKCQRQSYRQGYKPQFGWNPKTGEPWFALRCFAKKAYPALVGRDEKYLHELHRLAPAFVLCYERMGYGQDGSVLLWPEFKHKEDIKKLDQQAVFNYFRAFLSEWTSNWGEWSNGDWRVPISEAFIEFQLRLQPLQQALPLPGGFVFHPSFPQLSGLVSSQPQTRLPPPTRDSNSLTSRPKLEMSTSLSIRLKRPSSPLPDESRRKHRALGSSVVGGSEDKEEDNINLNVDLGGWPSPKGHDRGEQHS